MFYVINLLYPIQKYQIIYIIEILPFFKILFDK